MIRTLLCTALVVATLSFPAMAEDTPDISAIRGRQLYIEGKHDEAFAAIKPLAEQGVPRAEVILGFFYERGIGTAVDEALALQWYEKAAAHNQPAGLHNLGYAYQEGLFGLTKDMVKAKELYLKAAEMDYPASLHNLSHIYLYGEGAEVDTELGRALIERAVALGHPEAAADLGYILATGDGLPIDLERAREAYLIGAANGIDWAVRDYGEMQELGEGGPVDLAEAEEWYRRAHGLGNVMASFDMAEMLWANAATMPDRQVEALAWCYYAETNGPDFDGNDYTGRCAAPAAKLTPEEVTQATELAKTL